MAKTPEERRNSFRIETVAFIDSKSPRADASDAEDYFHDLQMFSLQAELNALSVQLDQLNERIKDMAALKSTQLLHQQIKILTKMSITQQAVNSQLQTQAINISEGGCSFSSKHELQVNDKKVLALIFSPSYFSLFAFARVCDCQPQDEQFIVHFEFTDLNEKQRQELVRFMFQAQTLAKKTSSEN